MFLKNAFAHSKLLLSTMCQTIFSLKESGQSVLIPFFLGLLISALVLFFLNSVSPIAPFVYSLF